MNGNVDAGGLLSAFEYRRDRTSGFSAVKVEDVGGGHVVVEEFFGLQ